MKRIALVLSALAVIAGISACGGKAVPTAATSSKGAASSSAPSSSPESTGAAQTNERAFADAMAASLISVQPQLVSGAVMTAYFAFEQEFTAALAASGSPDPALTVSPITGGYQLCESSSTTSCETFTAFTTNAAGQITGFSVDGRPVAGRLATGTGSTMHGLQVSGMLAYQLTSVENTVLACFQVKDVSYTSPTYDPAMNATFANSAGTFNDNNQASLPPQTLNPNTTVTACEGFSTTALAGTLSLLSTSDGSTLGTSTLTAVS